MNLGEGGDQNVGHERLRLITRMGEISFHPEAAPD